MKSFFQVKSLVFACSILFASFIHGQNSPAVSIPSNDSLDKWLADFKVPAVGVISIEKGKAGKARVRGMQTEGVPASRKTLFDVASLTKSFSTQLVLTLTNDGHWDLNEPLANYWVDPEVKDDPRHKSLTTAHCLSHQTGFVNWRWMHESKRLTFDFDPGSRVGYSGEGFEYMKKAVENKFGNSFDFLMDSLVFQPLKLKNTHLVWNEGVDSSLVAHGQDKEGNWHPFYKAEKVFASDNLLISLKDCGRFMKHTLEGGNLSKELFSDMVTPNAEMKPGMGIGYGWIAIKGLPNDEYALFNAGSDPGVNAVMLVLPKSNRALAVFTTGDNGRAIIMKVIAESMDVGEAVLQKLN